METRASDWRAVTSGGSIGFADHFEGAPEAGFREFVEAAADGDPVAEFGWAFVVDLGAGDDGENVGFGHRPEVHAHECGEAGAAGFDHPQVGDVVDDTAAVGVEKHDFFAGFEAGSGLRMGRILRESDENRNVGLREVVVSSG